MTKQLIRDALPVLIERDEKALDAFEKFLARRLRPEADAIDKLAGHRLLARLLSRPSPQRGAIEEYIGHLVGGSLQSPEALYEIAAALGLWPDKVGIDRNVLQPIFEVRNKIIHELDINLLAEHRTRNLRGKSQMTKFTKSLLGVAVAILDGVDAKLAPPPGR